MNLALQIILLLIMVFTYFLLFDDKNKVSDKYSYTAIIVAAMFANILALIYL